MHFSLRFLDVFPEFFVPRGQRARETFFQTFWGFRARRARETPVARGRVRKCNIKNLWYAIRGALDI